ncbi:MAG: hypothetical protein PVI90_07425 [Desulfobacteraceae bacterium]
MKKDINHLKLIVLVIFANMMIGCNPSTPPEEVSQIFFNYLANFDHQRAYDLLSQKQKDQLSQKKINRESFFGYLKAPIGNPLWMGLQYEKKRKDANGDKAALIYFSLKDMQSKQTVSGECRLILENDLWQVNHLKFEGQTAPLL